MNRRRSRYVRTVLLALGLALIAPLATPAGANWLTRIVRHADDAPTARAGKGVAGTIDEVGGHLKTLPSATRGRALAVEATDVGHWRLRNASGETFTAATPEELKRGVQLLAPMKTGEVVGHILFLTSETIFRHRERLKELPKDAEFNALFDGQVVRLVPRMIDGVEHYYLDTGGGLHVPISADAHRGDIRSNVHEVLWQLARPVDLAAIRVLALEPGSTTLLKRSPPASPGPGRMTVEAVDPERLPHMLSAVARGTVVITGRVVGATLQYKPSSGPERTLSLDGLRAAAAASDVNLVVVASATARQPGTRNWLWQRVDLTRVADGKTKPGLGDLVRQLTGSIPVEVQVTDRALRRAALSFTGLAGGGRGVTAPAGDAWRGLAPEVTGTIVANGLQLDLRSREHQRELDDRIIPGIPSGIQWAYICFFLLGIIGSSVAGRWWGRIWPLEERSDYPRRAGYWAARTARGALYLILFMPLVSSISAPIAMVRGLWGWIVTIYSFIVRPFRRSAA